MPKRPRDPNQLAKLIVDIATGEVQDPESTAKRNSTRRGITPAMAAGISDHIWSYEEIAALAN
ncbi:MAG: hypothetical protein WA476_09935 [Acidobacteriaceae bacterium]